MRIISGDFKGSSLFLNKKEVTRPLKDLARESIFNLLVHSNNISFQLEQSNILDLYAGTGSFGLECLSRRANAVYFVENEKSAVEILEKNIAKLKIKKKTKIIFDEVITFLEKKNFLEKKFDLIFCDPPFKDNNLDKLINLIFEKNLLNKKGIILFHRNKNSNDKFSEYLKVIEERTYGISKIFFCKILY